MAKKSKAKKSTHREQSSAKTGYIFDGVVGLLRTLGNTQKDWGVEKITEIADATKEYASSLKDIPTVGNYAKASAASLNDLAHYVSETEFDQILADSATFAKRHPIIVVIGCAVAGILAAQMVGANHVFLRTKRSAKKSRPPKSSKKSRNALIGVRPRKSNGHAHLNS